MSGIKVDDDFLSLEQFDSVRSHMAHNIGWKIGADDPPNDTELSPADNFLLYFPICMAIEPDNIDFYDKIEDRFNFRSDLHKFLIPLIKEMNARCYMRIKANLKCRTNLPVKPQFHCDFPFPKYDGLSTSIYYINTNNGYTEFEDGTRIESVENSLLTFPYSMKHRGVSCTDEPFRMVINFNYF